MNVNGFEIERKFLIKMPDRKLLDSFERSDIIQIYLKGEKGTTERVRKRTSGENFVYTHTIKRKVSNIRRFEDEREIDPEEYGKLLERADPGHRVVEKTRYCFNYSGELWELDIYPFWSDRAIMEIELSDENQKIDLPPFISIIREVTDDRRYSNAAISQSIPQD